MRVTMRLELCAQSLDSNVGQSVTQSGAGYVNLHWDLF